MTILSIFAEDVLLSSPLLKKASAPLAAPSLPVAVCLSPHGRHRYWFLDLISAYITFVLETLVLL
jgi:hypothetical protein